MTTLEVATEARRLLADRQEPYRWDNPAVLVYLLAGRLEIATRRPESMYVSGITTTLPAAPTAIDGSNVGLRDTYKTALAHYIAMRCLEEDSEDGNNAVKIKQFSESFIAFLS